MEGSSSGDRTLGDDLRRLPKGSPTLEHPKADQPARPIAGAVVDLVDAKKTGTEEDGCHSRQGGTGSKEPSSLRPPTGKNPDNSHPEEILTGVSRIEKAGSNRPTNQSCEGIDQPRVIKSGDQGSFKQPADRGPHRN